MQPKSHSQDFLRRFIGLSIILHLNLALVLATFLPSKPLISNDAQSLKPNEEIQDLALVSEDDILRESLRRDLHADELEQAEAEKLRKEEEKKKEEEERNMKGQVVDIAPSANEERPDHARFLAEHNSKVAKETKGPSVPFKPGRLLADRPPPPTGSGKPMSPGQQQEVERKVLKLAMRSVPKLPQVNEVDKNGTEPGQVKSEESNSDKILNQENSESFGGDGNNKKLTMKDLQLSDAELNRALGTRSNDYLENVEEGSQTLLNTKQWRYASFFNRVKRQVAQNWHPDVAYQRRDPDGNVYGFKDRLTVLRVQLTPQGRLKALAVEKPCGIDFLDEEAESAFRASEPFPNPPPGLVDKESGMITFRFGFLFEFSRRPGFRMFKYNN